ncbi:MAG: type I restriction enzyme HsdR N-terminal domain-containing protein, partial [Dehalococcoidia bacterium]|nr:type I restriction enzyme HsdR N-terminal domain-containing protein [Dehalococcoidia bacterium]
MPLESLLELVKTLSDRIIDEHGPALKQSEALTRYALIDPLLGELGWDTAAPDMVIPEYRSGNGRADYALMHNGSPAMMVEAKSLSTPLQDTVLSQGINYCLMEGTSYFAVTDGRLWEIYETHKPVPMDDKRIIRFDLKDDPAQVCLNALALWRSSIESGSINAGQAPVVGLPQDHSSVTQIPNPLAEEPVVQPTHTPLEPDREDWQPLSNFNPVRGSDRPTEIQFPDNSSTQIKYWRSIIVEATRWLVNNNLLVPDHCPIQLPSAYSRYLVDTNPTHPSGKSF